MSESREVIEISVPSPQFSCGPKAALKILSLTNINRQLMSWKTKLRSLFRKWNENKMMKLHDKIKGLLESSGK